MERSGHLTRPRDPWKAHGPLFTRRFGSYSLSISYSSPDNDCYLASTWEANYLKRTDLQEGLFKTLREQYILEAQTNISDNWAIYEDDALVAVVSIQWASKTIFSCAYDFSEEDKLIEIMLPDDRSGDRDLFARVLETCRDYIYSFNDAGTLFIQTSLLDAGSNDHLPTIEFARKTFSHLYRGYHSCTQREVYELIKTMPCKNRVREKKELLLVEDAILGIAFNQGKEAAFDVFFERYQQQLIAYAFRIVNNLPAAQDIVVETFVKTWQRRTQFKHPKNVQAFLFAVTRNACLNHLRDRNRHPTISLDTFFGDNLQETEIVHVSNEMPLDVLIVLIEKEIAHLPLKARKVVQLFKHGLDNYEVSKRLRMPQNTVRSNKRRAFNLIRARLKKGDE